MTDRGTWPPYDQLDDKGSYHWLHAERASGAAVAQWMGNHWICIGEPVGITPQQMRRRGWEYLGPCVRPKSKYLDMMTVQDLEAILQEPEADVVVQRDGSCSPPSMRSKLQDGIGIEDARESGESYLTYTDAPSALHIVDRRRYSPEQVEHLPKLRHELNNKEFEETQPEYKFMYERRSDSKWVLADGWQERWGEEQ